MAYLFWDPNPELFHLNLPFLHRGILWYGFLFALGFFIGYWIFLYLIRRYLIFHFQVRDRDIYGLSLWAKQLKSLSISSPLFPLFSALSSNAKDQCNRWEPGIVLPESFRKEIVASCNVYIQSKDVDAQPQSLFSKTLVRFAQNRVTSLYALKNRLALDEAGLPLLSLKKNVPVY